MSLRASHASCLAHGRSERDYFGSSVGAVDYQTFDHQRLQGLTKNRRPLVAADYLEDTMCRELERACWGVLLSCHTIRLDPRIVVLKLRPSHVRPLSPPPRLTGLKVHTHPRKADERVRTFREGGARRAGVAVEAGVIADSSWCMMSDIMCARHRRRAAAASSERQEAESNAARQSPGRESGGKRCRRGS